MTNRFSLRMRVAPTSADVRGRSVPYLELDRRRQDRRPDEPRAVGQIGPPAFLLPLPP